eukprot:jgi/Psemu1/233589/estExt_Genewise1.C_60023
MRSDFVTHNGTKFSDNMTPDDNEIMATRYILAVLYYALGGEEWDRYSFWLREDKEHCNWEYVYCRIKRGENGKPKTYFKPVTEFQLKDYNSLIGSLPSELLHLSKLREFQVGNNKQKLSNGEKRNKISSIQVFENGMDSLRFLNLDGNPIKSLKDLFRLTNLDTLDFSETDLKGTLPSDIQQLSKLTRLDLSDNALSGSLTNHFHTMSNLERINLGGNMELEGDLDVILNCSSRKDKLKTVRVDKTGIRGIFSEELLGFEAMEFFYVSHSKFSGSIPPGIKKWTNLKKLAVRACPSLTGTVPSELGELSLLTNLIIAGTGLTGSIPAELCAFADLTIFHSDGIDCSCSGKATCVLM